MKLSILLSNVKTKTFYVDRDISKVTVNSEEVVPNSMFIALCGENYDGHDYIEHALSKGAACVLAERKVEGVTTNKLIITDNCRKAASRVFSSFYSNPSDKMRLVAVTGTNGKTTVASLTAHIMKYAGYKTAFIGTLGVTFDGEAFRGDLWEKTGGTMTTPSPEHLYRILYELEKAGCEIVVMEASSHALSQYRIDAITFEMGAFLNFSRDHLDYHRTEEEYFKAKSRLLSLCRNFSVNYDDQKLKELLNGRIGVSAFSAQPETVAQDRVDATACACKNYGVDGMEYLYYSKDAIFKIRTKLWGMNGVYNSLAASHIALKMGISPVLIQGAISLFEGVSGRMEAVRHGGVLFVIDYAHTPDALEKALKCVGELKRSRIILLFGCGGDRDRSKRKIMGEVAQKYAHFTILSNDNPRNEEPLEIIRMIEDGFSDKKKYTVIADREEAVRYAVNMSRKGDVVLICGKGHERYIIERGNKRYFSEKEIIEDACKTAENSKKLNKKYPKTTL